MEQRKSTSLVTGSAYTVPGGSDEHALNKFWQNIKVFFDWLAG